MSIYKTARELRGKELQPGDKVLFSVRRKGEEQEQEMEYYAVEGGLSRKFLSCASKGVRNDEIFKALGLSTKEKDNWAEKIYGHSTSGDFPEANNFSNLTKLTIELFLRCEATLKRSKKEDAEILKALVENL